MNGFYILINFKISIFKLLIKAITKGQTWKSHLENIKVKKYLVSQI
jgi:hypothetical protein